MKKAILYLLLFCTWPLFTTAAQQSDRPTLRVEYDSTYLRSLPSRDAQPSGSVFEDDVLAAIGRNADGLWFQVTRPGRAESLGWISREAVSYSFNPGILPLTDTTTGVTGSSAVRDTGFAVLILGEANLRNRPNGSETVGTVPVNAVLPVLGRSADNLWFEVNYLGTVGWVAEFLARLTGDINSVPVNAASTSGIPAGGLPIIPPEIQRAQVQRFREYLIPTRDLALQMANYWQVIRNGEIAPCTPPANAAYYAYSARDIVELPELRRYVRRMERAVNELNISIELYRQCGIFTPEQISEGYTNATNSSVILNAVLDSLDNLEENIIPR
jgi:hypothetical protein